MAIPFIATCSRKADDFVWDFVRNGVIRARVIVNADFSTEGDIFCRVIESVTIYFNVISAFVRVTTI